MSIRKFVNDTLTEVDNRTFDIVKVLAMLSIVVGIVMAVLDVAVYDGKFSLQDYGTGIGILFAGAAVALGFKKESGV